jgi:hypothetical protein
VGVGVGISKNNLSNANIKKDRRISTDYANILIDLTCKICVDYADFNLDIESNVYAVDASTIDLFLEVFWWQNLKSIKVL